MARARDESLMYDLAFIFNLPFKQAKPLIESFCAETNRKGSKKEVD